MLTGASDPIGKRLLARTVGAGVIPAFMPKRNSALIGNYGRVTDDASLSKLANTRAVSLLAVAPASR